MTYRGMGARIAALLLAVLTLAYAGPTPAYVFPYENVVQFKDTMEFDGREREVLYLHPAIATTTPAPAVIVLHYLGGKPQPMANLTLAMEWVRDSGAWVILPQGTYGDWTDTPTDFHRRSDDVGFLSQLIEDSVARYGVDPARVYMTGYSRGGTMSLWMACERPDLLAAVASVASTLRKSASRFCAPSAPIPVLLFNGTADEEVGYDQSPLGLITPLETFAQFAALNGCTGTPAHSALPDRIDDGTRVELDAYGSCEGGAAVEMLSIIEGGHTWPGAASFVPQFGLTTQDISATSAMWQFFSRFSRP